MTVSHDNWNLLAKTELRVEDIGLAGVDLTALAAAAARVLALPAQEVYVIDARERLITFDLLRATIDPYTIVGRSAELLTAIGAVDGVTVTESTRVSSDGMLGWIVEDRQDGIEALDRSRRMIEEIEANIAARAIVFSTGPEVSSGQIADTNKPWIDRRLTDAGFRVTHGQNLPDDIAVISAAMREAVEERGFGLVVTTGGVGAETKDGTVEALLDLAPGASTPYLFHVETGHGRHAKGGVRIGAADFGGARIVCLPGPHTEATLGTEALVEGIDQGLDIAALAEHIAQALRQRFRAHGSAHPAGGTHP